MGYFCSRGDRQEVSTGLEGRAMLDMAPGDDSSLSGGPGTVNTVQSSEGSRTGPLPGLPSEAGPCPRASGKSSVEKNLVWGQPGLQCASEPVLEGCWGLRSSG